MSPARALFVDDDAMSLKLYPTVLKDAGIEAITFKSPYEALDVLKRDNSFDVIFTDLVMQEMSGLDFLRQVRVINLDIPVIIVTAEPSLGTAADAIEYGVFRYLIKPVPFTEIAEVAWRAVHIHKLAKFRRKLSEHVGYDPGVNDRAALESNFDLALQSIWLAFQPIVSWDGQPISRSNPRLMAYEALVRSDSHILNAPYKLFDAAESLDRVFDLSRLIRHKLSLVIPTAPVNVDFFLNLSPHELADPHLGTTSCPLYSYSTRVVIEVTERTALDQIPNVKDHVKRLRHAGFRIAVDDMGAGYAGLSSFIQLEPDIVKLDMSLIRDIDKDSRKISLVRGLNQLTQVEFNMKIIGEGVETIAERDALLDVGIDILQGYLFGRPERELRQPLIQTI